MTVNELVPSRTTRRDALLAGCTVLSAVLAGCLGDDEDDADDETGDAADGDNGSESDDETDGPESLVGVPEGTLADGVDLSNPWAVEETLVDQLDLTFGQIRTRVGTDVVEVYDDVSESDFVEALEAADVGTDEVEVRAGVTDETLDVILDVVETRLDETDVDASVAKHEERPAVVLDGHEAEADRVEDLLEPLRVELVAGYPDPDADEPVMETVVTQDDIAQVSTAQRANGESPAPHVPIQLSEEAAEQYATVMAESSFTTDGVEQCSFDSSDQPDADEYCLYTRFDGELIHGASMGPSLATVIENSEFVENPSFVLQTQDFETAQRLELALRGGQLPTELHLETNDK